uniref:Uncharacterized protein n=1 Tax=viral metagenome TaxID=1070528 RepID=A0A6M3KHZ9_9ZZZZ
MPQYQLGPARGQAEVLSDVANRRQREMQLLLQQQQQQRQGQIQEQELAQRSEQERGRLAAEQEQLEFQQQKLMVEQQVEMMKAQQARTEHEKRLQFDVAKSNLESAEKYGAVLRYAPAQEGGTGGFVPVESGGKEDKAERLSALFPAMPPERLKAHAEAPYPNDGTRIAAMTAEVERETKRAATIQSARAAIPAVWPELANMPEEFQIAALQRISDLSADPNLTAPDILRVIGTTRRRAEDDFLLDVAVNTEKYPVDGPDWKRAEALKQIRGIHTPQDMGDYVERALLLASVRGPIDSMNAQIKKLQEVISNPDPFGSMMGERENAKKRLDELMTTRDKMVESSMKEIKGFRRVLDLSRPTGATVEAPAGQEGGEAGGEVAEQVEQLATRTPEVRKRRIAQLQTIAAGGGAKAAEAQAILDAVMPQEKQRLDAELGGEEEAEETPF